jgi:hypothetical protein
VIPSQLPGQLRVDEVMAMVEFCVDLDSEDDRAAPAPRRIFNLRADRSLALWDCVADSRGQAAAADLNDPVKNGFAPFDTAWTLWKQKAPGADGQPVYALAFRGTVFANKPSAAEDALVNTISAHQGIQLGTDQFLPITFAALDGAEVHEGFAYGVFSAMFDAHRGALRSIQGLPVGSTLLLTGHSQGAALATLAHALLVYAGQKNQFGIAARQLTLRSYVFAQPRPGNLQFALDFAHITGGGVNSFVFNNTLDPVPMLPPSHQFAIEAFANLPGSHFGSRLARGVYRMANTVRGVFSQLLERSLARRVAELQRCDHQSFLFAEELRHGSTRAGRPGGSQSYTTAGSTIPLHGESNPLAYFHDERDRNDAFIQHHAPVYRELLEKRFALDVTDEASPQLRAPPPHLIASLLPTGS